MVKKISMLLCFALIFGMTAIPVYGAGISDVFADIDSFRQVTVGGMTGGGAGKPVSIKILDPEGDLEYTNSCVSRAGGLFSITYTLANGSRGRYTVVISTKGSSDPVKTYFDYSADGRPGNVALTAAASWNETSNLVIISGKTSSGAGKLITVRIKDPNGKIEYVGHTHSKYGGKYQLKYTLTNTAKGKYAVTVGTPGASKPAAAYFGYGTTEVSAGIDKNKLVTVNVSTGLSDQFISVLITDPKGKQDYLNSLKTDENGALTLSYTMTNMERGRYNVSARTPKSDKAATAFFDYQPYSALLSDLTLSGASLSPAFSSDITTYSANVANTVASMTATPIAVDETAVIKVNDTAVANRTASGSIGLKEGNNFVNVVVTALDGTAKTYSITVNRATAPVTETPTPTPPTAQLSDNNSLSGLSLSDGTLSPAFDAGTVNYTASVANAVSSIIFTPAVAESHAAVKVKLNGILVSSQVTPAAISPAVGSNAVTVEVTAQNGAVKTYTITVTRAAPHALSSNANLSSLVLNTGTLSPAFTPATTSYAVSYVTSVSSIVVTPAVEESNAAVKVRKNNAIVADEATPTAINLDAGDNTITVEVTAQDGTVKTYTITATREHALTGLEVYRDEYSQTNLLNGFDADQHSYTLNGNLNDTGVYVKAAAIDPDTAVIAINGTNVTSGGGRTVTLDKDVNNAPVTTTITITVTLGGITETYTVTVNIVF